MFLLTAYLAAGVVCFQTGNIFAKHFALHGGTLKIALGITAYAAALVLTAFAMRRFQVSVFIPAISIANLLAVNAIAYFYFGERFTPLQLLGVALGVAAVLLITGFSHAS